MGDDANDILRWCERPRTRIRDVVDLLAGIQPHLDVVNRYAASFNFLYLSVTKRVGEFEELGLYENPRFLQTLDLRFADRYVKALTGWLKGEPEVPAAWMMLFEPDQEELEPSQYAALGVNAHINVDLALALIATCDELGIEPLSGSGEHHDYLMVNQVFYEVIPPLKRVFVGFQPEASLLDSLENWIVQIIVDQTRDQAWDEACRFYAKRHKDGYLAKRKQKLDFTACLFGDAIVSTPFRAFLVVTEPSEPPTWECSEEQVRSLRSVDHQPAG